MTRQRRHPQPPSERLRELRIGDDACCDDCGCDDLPALQRTAAGGVTCYRCDAARFGRSATEEHHPAGHSVPSTVPMPSNLHRVLSERQASWPEGVLANPQRDPLLSIAGALFAVADIVAAAPPSETAPAALTLLWLAGYAMRFGHWLVLLVAEMRARHGDRWWEALDLPGLLDGVR